MTQRRAAGYNRLPHACDGPNRTSLRSHPDQCDANQAPFPQPTRLHAPKRGVFGKAVYQSVLIYVVYWIRTIESDKTYAV